jgi:RNA polymerase sigma-70 factor (ECF subfamily)
MNEARLMTSPIASELVALLPRLRRFAVVLCKSQVSADDLVQAACVRALANAQSWTPGTRFDSWMFRILHNHWLDTMRRARTEGIVQEIDVAARIVGTDGESQMMRRFQLAEIRDAIDTLPDDQREVLLLVCIEDLSYREAAEILNVPVGTVMSRLARARRRLVELVEAA